MPASELPTFEDPFLHGFCVALGARLKSIRKRARFELEVETLTDVNAWVDPDERFEWIRVIFSPVHSPFVQVEVVQGRTVSVEVRGTAGEVRARCLFALRRARVVDDPRAVVAAVEATLDHGTWLHSGERRGGALDELRDAWSALVERPG